MSNTVKRIKKFKEGDRFLTKRIRKHEKRAERRESSINLAEALGMLQDESNELGAVLVDFRAEAAIARKQ